MQAGAARVFPSDWRQQESDSFLARERAALTLLAEGLGDGYTIYHGVHWTRLEQGLTVLGRIQFLVQTPSGMLVLIAMKTGVLRVEQGRIIKPQGHAQQDVLDDVLEQGEGLARQYFMQHQKTLRFEPLLYFPDFKVRALDGVALQARRVVDATSTPGLCESILAINQAAAESALAFPEDAVLHRFLSNTLDLVPELGALTTASEQCLTRLTQGLEDWVGRLSFLPFRLRVSGTAGSGKSQLALRELQQNHRHKARTLYLCYNRPLAVHMQVQIRQLDLMGAQAFNFHALCDRVLRDAGQTVDFAQPGAFDALVERAAQLPVDRRWIFDSIVVDEGQDFEPHWLEVLQGFAHPATRWIWLEDPAQNLYNKPVQELPGWVQLRVPLNYRNPQHVVQALQGFESRFALQNPSEFHVQAMCPLEGYPVEFLSYSADKGPLEATSKAITQCLKLGFTRDQMVLLTLRGHEKSRVLKERQIGPHALRHFTGQYDEQGSPLFTEGGVLAESVYRFKGQSAAAVVLTEFECEAFDEADFRKLFVGMTRAKMLVLIVGEARALARLRPNG